MNDFSSAQSVAVRHGEEVSVVESTLPIVYAEYEQDPGSPGFGGGRKWSPSPEVPSVFGIYAEVYQVTVGREWETKRVEKIDGRLQWVTSTTTNKGKWFYWHQTDGGGSGSTSYDTKEEAEAALRVSMSRGVKFWDEIVEAWQKHGSVQPKDSRGKVARAFVVGGIHYVAYPGRGHGFGGRRFRFQYLDSGEIFESEDTWYQGRVPLEYREALPDNARILPEERYQRISNPFNAAIGTEIYAAADFADIRPRGEED